MRHRGPEGRSCFGPSSCSIQRSAWKEYSPKFGVSSDPAGVAAGARKRRRGSVPRSKRPYQVAFVAPSCSKALRLATLQLPEKFSPIGPRQTELRLNGVLGSCASPCHPSYLTTLRNTVGLITPPLITGGDQLWLRGFLPLPGRTRSRSC